MKASLRLLAVVTIFGSFVALANAETYYWKTGGGTSVWNDGNNWLEDASNTQPAVFPNGEGDVAVFQSSQVTNVNGSTTAHTTNRTINMNSDISNPLVITLGQLNFNDDVLYSTSPPRNIINTGNGIASFIMDGAGSSDAQINLTNLPVSGSNQASLNDINVPIQLNDQLHINVNSTLGRNDNLNLRMRGLVTSNPATPTIGGITRTGVQNSLLIWPTPNTGGGLQYNGPTYLGDPGATVDGTYGTGGGGRNQFATPSATPTNSSSFHVVGNAQLGMTNDGTYQFGAVNAVLYFNSDGTGNTGGQGALRPERTAARPTQTTITNTSVVLQGPTTLFHSEGQIANGTDPSQGWIQLTGVISGGPTNKLQLSTTVASANKGSYVLSGANTFSGGIDLYGGRLTTDIISDGGVFNSSNTTTHPNATFGTGNIHIIAQNPAQSLAISRMTIPSGVLNAIGDTATLSIDDLNRGGCAACAELGDNIVERVGALVLDGVTQQRWKTYGSSLSNADIKNDTFFSGTGVIQVGLPGDFNNDGSVNAADYVSWRKTDGTDAGYTLFRQNFQPSPEAGPSLQGAAVPEPTAFVLISLCASLLVAGRRRRIA